MREVVFALMFVVLLAAPLVHSDDKIKECESKCLGLCSDKTDEIFRGCFKVCMDTCLKSKNPQRETMKLTPDVPPPQPADPQREESENDTPVILAQNANYIPCYKEVDMKMVLFRWCPRGYPWTATNENRTGCYATSEACAAAEMPQSWCIKCGSKD